MDVYMFTTMLICLLALALKPPADLECQPCVCSTATGTQSSGEPIGSLGSGQYYASMDNCETIDGLNIQPTTPYDISRGSRVCPALKVEGSALVEGPMVVQGCPMIEIEPGHFMNLCFALEQLKSLPGAVCGTCVHGISTFDNCTCVCEPYWTGATCEESTCNGHGTWNSDTEVCTCDPGYVAPYCMTGPLSHPPPETPNCTETCHLHGSCDADDTCVCDPGWTGAECEHECAGPVIGPDTCAGRPNWGWDFMSVENSTFVCGGGYQPDSNFVYIASLACSDNATECEQLWLDESPVCCAPGVFCGKRVCASDNSACCAGLNRAQCRFSGCAWCNGTCASETLGNASDCLPPYLEAANGDWRGSRFDCSNDNESTVCDLVTANAYIDMYTQCLVTPTRQCFEAVRIQVNKQSWPRLASTAQLAPEYNYALESHAGYLGLVEPVTASAAAARWLPTPQKLRLVPVHEQEQNEQSEYLVFQGYYCLVADDAHWQTQVSLFGRVLGGDNLVYWRDIRSAQWLLPYDTYCTGMPLGTTSVLGINGTQVIRGSGNVTALRIS